MLLKGVLFFAIVGLNLANAQTQSCDKAIIYDYSGYYYDMQSQSYKEGMELGTLEIFLEVFSCKFHRVLKRLSLRGNVYNNEIRSIQPVLGDTINSSLAFIEIVKVKNINGGYVELSTVAVSDTEGDIQFRVKLRESESLFFRGVGFMLYQLKLASD